MPTNLQDPYTVIAEDLAQWLEDMSTELAAAMKPYGVAPFAAQISQQQKLLYYASQLFNPDGTPNMAGRNAELARLGPLQFRMVFRAVVAAFPWLAVPTPPEGAPTEALP